MEDSPEGAVERAVSGGDPVRLQHLLDAFPYYVLVVDERHTIVAANKHIFAHVDDPGGVIGGFCPAVIHGEPGPIHHCPLEDSVVSGAPESRELFDTQSGRWLLSAVYPMDAHGDDGSRLYLHTAVDITAQKEAEIREHEAVRDLHTTLGATVEVMARSVEAKDPYTAGHQRRVARLSAAIAARMGLPDSSIEAIRVAASVHDLGKIGVPGGILNKPGRLDEAEFERVREHPLIAYGILEPAEFPWPIADIVVQHHERLDGSGYPAGLSGDEIAIEARIIAVADVVEAMTLDRPYRPALGLDAALAAVIEGRGTLYDAKVVDACVAAFRDGFELLPDAEIAQGPAA